MITKCKRYGFQIYEDDNGWYAPEVISRGNTVYETGRIYKCYQSFSRLRKHLPIEVKVY